MEKEVRYDRTSLCTRNFTTLDRIVFWTWSVGWVAIILSIIVIIWTGIDPFWFKILLTIFAITIICTFYMRAVWVDPNRTHDITYRKEYSKIIDEDLHN